MFTRIRPIRDGMSLCTCPPCPVCGIIVDLPVRTKCVRRYLDGYSLQEAFPDAVETGLDRFSEQIASGMCNYCEDSEKYDDR